TAVCEKISTNVQSLAVISIEDDDDNNNDITTNNSKIEIKKPIKPVRFVSIIDENSLTPTLPRPSSLQPTLISSSSIMQIDNKTNQDTLWDFMKESNSELFEKLEKIYNDKKKHVDRFSIPQPTSSNKTNTKITKSIPISDTEVLKRQFFNEKLFI
ncbi:unnamed protein product, partial [Rotaria sp. Silwood2]